MALKIASAFYGVTGSLGGKDVTAIAQKIVQNGNDDIIINNVTMGGDPLPGKAKQFGVIYSYEDGTFHFMTGAENTTIDLVP